MSVYKKWRNSEPIYHISCRLLKKTKENVDVEKGDESVTAKLPTGLLCYHWQIVYSLLCHETTTICKMSKKYKKLFLFMPTPKKMGWEANGQKMIVFVAHRENYYCKYVPRRAKECTFWPYQQFMTFFVKWVLFVCGEAQTTEQSMLLLLLWISALFQKSLQFWKTY